MINDWATAEETTSFASGPLAIEVRIVAVMGMLSLLMILCGPLIGCNSRPSGGRPHIEFTRVPVIGKGDATILRTIKGWVTGAQPGQQIVLYARAVSDDGRATWYVQPFAREPFTEIRSNSSWSNSTHPGTDYAALLVESGFHPPLTTEVLPSEGVVTLAIAHGEPPYQQRWWFPWACIMGGALVIATGVLMVYAFHRLRLQQMTRKLNLRFEERLGERMRVARELHDTLLQGFVSASMQLHVAETYLPTNSPAKPLVGHVLEIMGNVIEEGRNAIRGLRTAPEDAQDLALALSRIPQELAGLTSIDLRVIVEGAARPLRPGVRDEVYFIGREALVNAFRHSHASKIEAELDYASGSFWMVVRDNGCGIAPHVLATGCDGHWGLSGIRERAERMGAKLKILSRAATGTEIGLLVPGHIAFEYPSNDRPGGWFTKLFSRSAKGQISEPQSEEMNERTGADSRSLR